MTNEKTLLEVEAGTRRLAGWFFKRFCQGEDIGQSLIEFAVCLPLLLLIVTGIMTFGVALNQYMQLTEAVSTGARQFAISRGYQGDQCATTIATIQTAAPSLNKNNLTYSFQVYSSATVVSGTYTTSCANALLYQGTPLVVTASYPCNLVWYKVNTLKTGNCTLTAKTTEVVQ